MTEGTLAPAPESAARSGVERTLAVIGRLHRGRLSNFVLHPDSRRSKCLSLFTPLSLRGVTRGLHLEQPRLLWSGLFCALDC